MENELNQSETVTLHVIPVMESTQTEHPSSNYSARTGVQVSTRKRSKNYKQDSVNGRAVQVMKSWLSASNVPILPGSVGDFAIQKSDGQKMEVVVASTIQDPRPLTADALVTILAPEVTHPNRTIALSAFHTVTEAGGYGKPTPVERGPEPEQRISYQEDFELVVMRHREFRNAPNPIPGELEKYERVVMNVCWWLYRANRPFFESMGYEAEDLKSYAQVFATNFLHKYKIDESKVTNSDNERLMTNHLKQRLVELIAVAKKKSRNITIAPDVALLGSINSDTHALSLEITKDEYRKAHTDFVYVTIPQVADWVPVEDEDYKTRKTELNLKSDLTRRNSAKKLLEARLSELPHNRMVETLIGVQKSSAFCPDTREEASKRLRKHLASCSECQTKVKG